MFDKEYNQRLLEDCKDLIPEANQACYLGNPIIVKTTPHTEIYRCYGYMITEDGRLLLMDPSEQWDEILPDQANAGYVLQSLYQRLKILKVNVA